MQLVLLGAVVFLPGGDAWTAPGWLATGMRILQALGLAVVVTGLLNLGRARSASPMPVVGGELHSNGLFRSVRHPIYSGIIAIAIGSAVRSGSAAVAAATLLLIGWLMLKARWEERLLLDRYPGYASYAARTPRFVPFAIRHRMPR